ncbi:endo-1,4-D-glucanase [Pusillimonas sp. T2]|uniref:cellulose synthase complex periplasmic endoglucanase BcsZ n=1 Tax=Pusillimonas sp. T2 TaxID=1548123 RepID=UPI000B8EDC65|nr:cellulose synthase complex periplasmic endoglucanase BcsZ [Pusillimonas sp. T2]OXR50703.1 endo-1,4-D-glucanase [Pusillimonas sp. T2]
MPRHALRRQLYKSQHPQPGRRRFICSLAASGLLAVGGNPMAQTEPVASTQCRGTVDWPQWQTFLEYFVQPDGRVLDASTPEQHSSSEGQSYGMFFALIANDCQTFEKMWRWAVNNLANGDIYRNLPAWIWGKDKEGNWRVLDNNSASDAELWFIYSLLEAGKRWGRPDYTNDALALLRLVETLEIDTLPSLGKMLLPGPNHFVLPNNIWRLNPSYLPLPVLRRLASVSPNGPWNEVIESTVALLQATTPKGFVADWVCYQANPEAGTGMFITDPDKGDVGSYDAIRVYLWAGMTPADDPLAQTILDTLYGMAIAVKETGAPPERVDTKTGVGTNTGPAGFSSALAPYFHARNELAQMNAQYNRAASLLQANLLEMRAKAQQPPYYDNVLDLFSTGWQQGHYRFTASGDLQLQWDR